MLFILTRLTELLNAKMMHEYDDDFFFEEDKICSISQPKNEGNNSSETSNINIETSDDVVIQFEDQDCGDFRRERYMLQYQDLLGMMVTSGNVVLTKDDKNLIGISIGGGAPLCPCLYIVQIFDGTPASKDGTLQSGDELTGVNGQSVKGKTKVEVAKMIQSAKEDVIINYNKLHADPKQGKSLDLIMKKMKHRLVEKMSSGTADALGLSRAILCNDTLVAKLNELKETEAMYKRLVDHCKRMLKAYFDVIQTYKAMGDVFAAIGVREPQSRASEAFSKFANYHRQLDKDGIKMLKTLKPILSDMGTYLHKAIPDTKLTIRKYADTKFEYLSYCLKVKEMDDEEHGYSALQEPLYRLETGNYEYRLILRCRQDARARFARLRADVLVKLELLDNKRTQDVALQLRRLAAGLAQYLLDSTELLKEHSSLFPVEVDLSQNAFQYKSMTPLNQETEDDECETASEVQECYSDKEKTESDLFERLIPDIDDPQPSEIVDNLRLLSELGLADVKTGDLITASSMVDISLID